MEALPGAALSHLAEPSSQLTTWAGFLIHKPQTIGCLSTSRKALGFSYALLFGDRHFGGP